jgi:hypothetical protein
MFMAELERFFRFLDAILTRLAADRRSRPTSSKITYRHDHAKILKLLLLALAYGWSLNDLGHKLTHLRNTLYRRLIGMRRSELPHWTTVARRRRSLAFLRYLRRVLRALSKEACLSRRSDLKLIVIDLTDLPTDPRWDPEGRWGHVTQEAFYGWKLHLVVNRKGVILAAYLTTAEKKETACVTSLLVGVWKLLPARWRKELIQVVSGDEGYDAEEVHRLIHDLLLCEAAISLNPRVQAGPPQGPHRLRTWGFLPTKEGRRAQRARQVIERTNRTLKEDLKLEEQLLAPEPWTAIKVGVQVWLTLVRYNLGRLLGMRSGSYSEGVKALVF